MVMSANSAANARSARVGKTALDSPSPRQVVASRPSTAQRAGTTTVMACTHFGNRKVGIHAPPSITMTSTASVLTPRAERGDQQAERRRHEGARQSDHRKPDQTALDAHAKHDHGEAERHEQRG